MENNLTTMNKNMDKNSLTLTNAVEPHRTLMVQNRKMLSIQQIKIPLSIKWTSLAIWTIFQV